MTAAARIAAIGALLCASLFGCTRDQPTVDTTSTDYLFESVFNRCREIPQSFLDKHRYQRNAEKPIVEKLVEGAMFVGCFYKRTEDNFFVSVSNLPFNQTANHTKALAFDPVNIAGRNVKAQNPEVLSPVCVIYVEIAGGTLELNLQPNFTGTRPCPVLYPLAEELIPLLPQAL